MEEDYIDLDEFDEVGCSFALSDNIEDCWI